jgi:hypothetical protein
MKFVGVSITGSGSGSGSSDDDNSGWVVVSVAIKEVLVKFLNTWLFIVLVSPVSNVIYPFKISLVAFIYECAKVKYASSDEFKFELFEL